MKTLLIIAAIYGTLIGNELKKAPDVVTIGNKARPTSYLDENTANRCGYWLVKDEHPSTKPGYYASATGYKLIRYKEEPVAYRIEMQYEIKPNPPDPPRRFYKYDISAACEEAGILDDYMSFVNTNPKVKWFYDDATSVLENDPYFIGVTNTVISSGKMTETQVRAIIDRAYELGTASER